MPAAPCGECKFFEEVHQITPKLSEGWCKVSSEHIGFVLSEETCNKWELK